jgi:flagellar biosynthesis GTPase FlhF
MRLKSYFSETVEAAMELARQQLLSTRLDETDRYGALISEPSRRGLPVSFLATGQQIPDDLEPATKARLIEMVAAPHCATDEPLPKTIGAAA